MDNNYGIIDYRTNFYVDQFKNYCNFELKLANYGSYGGYGRGYPGFGPGFAGFPFAG